MTSPPRRRDLPERHATIREDIRRRLRDEPLTALDLSARVGISEKDVAGHLEHLGRSVKSSGERLEIEPVRCVACGFTFKDRTKLSKPSRCPQCKGQRLTRARYRITGGG